MHRAGRGIGVNPDVLLACLVHAVDYSTLSPLNPTPGGCAHAPAPLWSAPVTCYALARSDSAPPHTPLSLALTLSHFPSHSRQGHEDEVARVGSSLASYFAVFHRLLSMRLKAALNACTPLPPPQGPPPTAPGDGGLAQGREQGGDGAGDLFGSEDEADPGEQRAAPSCGAGRAPLSWPGSAARPLNPLTLDPSPL